jgi:hypothetical protein
LPLPDQKSQLQLCPAPNVYLQNELPKLQIKPESSARRQDIVQHCS